MRLIQLLRAPKRAVKLSNLSCTWETATKETVQPLAVKGKPSGLTYRPSGLTRTGTSVFNPSGLARNVNVYPSHKKVPALTKANNGFSYHEISSDSEKEKVSDAPLSDWLDDNEDAEREAAVTSPVKVKQRLTSTVRINCVCSILTSCFVTAGDCQD